MTTNRFIGMVLAIVILIQIASLGLAIKSNEGTDSNTKHLEALVVEQQHTRENAILHTCTEEDERHLQARKGLEALVKEDGKPPKTAEEKEKVEFFLEGFVNSLVPNYNCAQRLREQTTP
jgi:hypothetical protein